MPLQLLLHCQVQELASLGACHPFLPSKVEERKPKSEKEKIMQDLAVEEEGGGSGSEPILTRLGKIVPLYFTKTYMGAANQHEDYTVRMAKILTF